MFFASPDSEGWGVRGLRLAPTSTPSLFTLHPAPQNPAPKPCNLNPKHQTTRPMQVVVEVRAKGEQLDGLEGFNPKDMSRLRT